jgi:hypothetical protein
LSLAGVIHFAPRCCAGGGYFPPLYEAPLEGLYRGSDLSQTSGTKRYLRVLTDGFLLARAAGSRCGGGGIRCGDCGAKYGFLSRLAGVTGSGSRLAGQVPNLCRHVVMQLSRFRFSSHDNLRQFPPPFGFVLGARGDPDENLSYLFSQVLAFDICLAQFVEPLAPYFPNTFFQPDALARETTYLP